MKERIAKAILGFWAIWVVGGGVFALFLSLGWWALPATIIALLAGISVWWALSALLSNK